MLDDDRESIIDGLFFTSLAAVMDVESLVPAVGQALGFTFYGEGEPKDQLFGYLRGKRLLLILDNFEHQALRFWSHRG